MTYIIAPHALTPDSIVWAATTTNEDFLRMEGMKSVIEGDHHRQEIVAGDMSEYLTGGKSHDDLVIKIY